MKSVTRLAEVANDVDKYLIPTRLKSVWRGDLAVGSRSTQSAWMCTHPPPIHEMDG